MYVCIYVCMYVYMCHLHFTDALSVRSTRTKHAPYRLYISSRLRRLKGKYCFSFLLLYRIFLSFFLSLLFLPFSLSLSSLSFFLFSFLQHLTLLCSRLGKNKEATVIQFQMREGSDDTLFLGWCVFFMSSPFYPSHPSQSSII